MRSPKSASPSPPTTFTRRSSRIGGDHRAIARSGISFRHGGPSRRCAALGLSVTHLYGLTESFGTAVICDWRSEWDGLPAADQAMLRARQGLGNLISCTCTVRVLDQVGRDVLRDGETMGEVALRGNDIMLGYYRDEAATEAVVRNGWFHTDDLGVLHPDAYLEIRDRAKDVIISGGENISSVKVKAALASHPAVLECAVLVVPDEHWGERPRALVTLEDSHEASIEELRDHVRVRLAPFKIPNRVEFGAATEHGDRQDPELRVARGNLGRQGPGRCRRSEAEEHGTPIRPPGKVARSSHDHPGQLRYRGGGDDRGHDPMDGMARR